MSVLSEVKLEVEKMWQDLKAYDLTGRNQMTNNVTTLQSTWLYHGVSFQCSVHTDKNFTMRSSAVYSWKDRNTIMYYHIVRTLIDDATNKMLWSLYRLINELVSCFADAWMLDANPEILRINTEKADTQNLLLNLNSKRTKIFGVMKIGENLIKHF